MTTNFTPQVGFIGFGKMAQALWKGISANKLVAPEDVYIFEKNKDVERNALQTWGVKTGSLQTISEHCNIILFCIKPQQLSDLMGQFPDANLDNICFVSILAGTTAQTFESHLGENIQLVRVMPNTPALVGEGMSALYFNAQVNSTYKAFVTHIFEGLGKAIQVKNETDLDVVTGISGSGPAFIYRIAKAIADCGENQGLGYEDALVLISQTLVGAGKMLLESGRSPQELISDVSSPNGTTVAGLSSFDQTQIDNDIQNVIMSAINRSRELSKDSE
jgi:pyrroline-5-carboxylate reductase